MAKITRIETSTISASKINALINPQQQVVVKVSSASTGGNPFDVLSLMDLVFALKETNAPNDAVVKSCKNEYNELNGLIVTWKEVESVWQED